MRGKESDFLLRNKLIAAAFFFFNLAIDKEQNDLLFVPRDFWEGKIDSNRILSTQENKLDFASASPLGN